MYKAKLPPQQTCNQAGPQQGPETCAKARALIEYDNGLGANLIYKIFSPIGAI